MWGPCRGRGITVVAAKSRPTVLDGDAGCPSDTESVRYRRETGLLSSSRRIDLER
jgi:hypothetical protein